METAPEVLTLVIRVRRMVKVELMLARLAKSPSLVLFIKEKGMLGKNLLVFFSVGKKDSLLLLLWYDGLSSCQV